MAKIQPLPLPAAAAASPPSCSPSGDGQSLQKQAEYTVWMKSLVFNGNGCTVYGADGGVAFRVDNYGCRGGREVFLMDRAGKTLIRIQRKGRLGLFRRWEACRYSESDDGEETTTPWFRVQKQKADDGKNGAAVTMMHHGRGGSAAAYTIGWCAAGKLGYEVTGAGGAVAAAVERKRTPSGVVLGDDVLTLTVGAGTDHLLALGLVVVCGLMKRCL
ncbi:protein LURP-one-related 11 [Sorghum bicolor]|uniref:Protein LURP-one-related 11 n=1 Tax=Sorghum bicolor TaxID=4558 RepID=C5XH25_SORBI|nr:protein LURP-one-related 11 [Sorghum bicolor]EES04156.1 hypothetical protein SORBI_3003G414800 [Sorghum bicolor]|eukprot:XP_002459036.1 protein LURP-one-related 11 [Sorghum bicolor]